MSSSFFLPVLLGIVSFVYMQGKRKAWSMTASASGSSGLHSRPGYYGMLVALWCLVPAVIIFIFWTFFSDSILTALALRTLPDSMQHLPPDQANLLVNNLRNLVAGHVAARDIDPVLACGIRHVKRNRAESTVSLYGSMAARPRRAAEAGEHVQQ